MNILNHLAKTGISVDRISIYPCYRPLVLIGINTYFSCVFHFYDHLFYAIFILSYVESVGSSKYNQVQLPVGTLTNGRHIGEDE
jgi:hypothetical protein